MRNLMSMIKEFAKERNWEQFHSPKNLAIGISVESNELLEILIWMTDEETKTLSREQLSRVCEEIGDITINLFNFCNQYDIDPIECAITKLHIIKDKYPIEKAFGSAKKYNEL